MQYLSSIGSALGGLGGLFGSNPSDDAMKYLEKIAPMLKEYMEPSINAGNRQLPGLEQNYGQMMNKAQFDRCTRLAGFYLSYKEANCRWFSDIIKDL